MAEIGEYTFLVTNLLTGKVIAEVDLQSMHWETLYNKPGSGRATARIHHHKTTPENFQSWNNGLWVVKDGDIRFGGWMGAIHPRAGTGVIEIPINAFSDYLRTRVVRSSLGMTYGAQTGNDIKWTNVDQFRMASDVIAHTQQGNGNIGITATWDALSGVLRTETIHTYENKKAGDWFEDLAARENGFGWQPRYHYVGDDPKCQLFFKYPRIGRVTTFKLRYQGDDASSNIMTVDTDGGTMPITGRLFIVGAGEGDDMLRATLESPLGGVDYDEVVSYKDVSVAATLTEKGNYIVRARSTQGRTFTIKLDWNMSPHYPEIDPGDQVEVLIDDGYMQVDTDCTVIGKKVVLSPTHDEETTLSLIETTYL